MNIRFTKHAGEKLVRIRKSGFPVTQFDVISTIKQPLKTESRPDGIIIASRLIDQTHILRVVYRVERDIMIVITCYPARRKAYGL